jgi:hypothetical protein
MEYQVKVDIITNVGVMHDMVIVKAIDELDAEQQAALTVWSLWDSQSVEDITIKEVNQMTENYTPRFSGASAPAVPFLEAETDGYQPYFNQATGRFHDPETNQMVKAPVENASYTPYEALGSTGDYGCDVDEYEEWPTSSVYCRPEEDCTPSYTSYGPVGDTDAVALTSSELAELDEELGFSLSTEALTNLRETSATAALAIAETLEALFDALADI